MRLALVTIWILFGQAFCALAWRLPSTGQVQRSSLSDARRPNSAHNLASDVRWSESAKRIVNVARALNKPTRVDIVDAKGEDIWDGAITNEDMWDILNDRFGLLAVTLGVLALVLLCMILLTLTLAYTTNKKLVQAYKELDGEL